jgi:hypothetical protein
VAVPRPPSTPVILKKPEILPDGTTRLFTRGGGVIEAAPGKPLVFRNAAGKVLTPPGGAPEGVPKFGLDSRGNFSQEIWERTIEKLQTVLTDAANGSVGMVDMLELIDLAKTDSSSWYVGSYPTGDGGHVNVILFCYSPGNCYTDSYYYDSNGTHTGTSSKKASGSGDSGGDKDKDKKKKGGIVEVIWPRARDFETLVNEELKSSTQGLQQQQLQQQLQQTAPRTP